MRVQCGKYVFNTIKEFQTHVTKLKSRIGICPSIKVYYPEEYEFIHEVLKRHPKYDEKTKNMIDMMMSMNVMKTGLELNIIRENGDVESISLNTAIKGKTENNDLEFRRACRTSILSQILEFREKSNMKCEFCGSTENIHIDHIIHFEKIVCDFIKEYNVKIPRKYGKKMDGTNQTCFHSDDNMIELMFSDYHKEHSKLRCLCQKCNNEREIYNKNIN
jgi:hypothetical protein